MNDNLLNYSHLQLLYEGKHTLIFRAKQQADNQSVILKILRKEYSSSRQVSKLKSEFALMQNFNSIRVVQALGIEWVSGQLILVLEDFGGQALSSLIPENGFDVSSFLSIAIALSEGLEEIHRQHIIHKDIKPQNIIVNLEDDQIKITDFGIATLLSREMSQIFSLELLEGTLAYISPEQTGRMNRAIDCRTDIYSLGVTFYEMITGKLPFQTQDSMLLIHQHIAQVPIPPHEVIPEISEVLSHIIMKCLAKVAEDRYYSAYGLKSDLEECRKQLMAQGVIVPFELGKTDLFERFQIPQKLYGRDEEEKILFSTFERVVKGTTEMVLVTGAAGMGKSTLVNEIQRHIVERQAYYIAGKFDQAEQGIPLGAFIQAFHELIQQILMQGEEEIQHWKERLLKALNVNAQLIIDIIPEVELIIGAQPMAAKIMPQEGLIRFSLVFLDFIGVFLQAEHPLVLFLDNLQWIDEASTKLILSLMSDPAFKYLLIIGAYRNEEVSEIHLLKQMIKSLRVKGKSFEFLEIKPLDFEAVKQFIGDTFHSTPEQVSPLASLVYQKTEGTPFFVSQFLKMLYDLHLLRFDWEARHWDVEFEEVVKLQVTENVADLMANKISSLPPSTLEILKVAAAIGNTFDLQTLAHVQKQSVSKIASDLWQALVEDLIVMKDCIDQESQMIYAFQHDRIQQAAYKLIKEQDHQALHYAIGKAMLHDATLEKQKEQVMAIVNQLNYGVDLIQDRGEKINLAMLNLIAGEKARDSGAFAIAEQYFSTGIRLLPSDCWEKEYTLSFALYENLCTSLSIMGNLARAEDVFNVVLNKAQSLEEKGGLYVLKILIHTQTSNTKEALACGWEGLKLFGISPPREQIDILLLWEDIKLKFNLLTQGFESFAGKSRVRDPRISAIGNLYYAMSWPVYEQGDLRLYHFITLKLLNLIFKYGLWSHTPYALTTYGVVLLSEVRQEYEMGYGVAKMALDLAEKQAKNRYYYENLATFYILCSRWKQHQKLLIEKLHDLAYQCINAGIPNLAGACLVHNAYFAFLTSDTVDDALVQIEVAFNQALKLKPLTNIYKIAFIREFCSALKGLTTDPICPYPKEVIEKFMLSEAIPGSSVQFFYETWHIVSLFMHENYAEAIALSEERIAFPEAAGNPCWNVLYYYYALSMAAASPGKKRNDKSWDDLLALLERLKKWAVASPMNYRQHFLLISAEVARLSQRIQEAEELYDQAIEAAIHNGYILDQAVCHEVAAKFYLNRGMKKIALVYMTGAYTIYANWGAISKLNFLQKNYRDLLEIYAPSSGKFKDSYALTQESKTYENLGSSTSSQTTLSTGALFDVASIIQASQAFSGEIVLNKLLAKLMHILIMSAGAEKAILMVSRNHILFVQAEMNIGQEGVELWEALPLEAKKDHLCLSIVRYVQHSMKDVLLGDATKFGAFTQDPYVVAHKINSILCLPLINHGEIIGVLYLENSLSKGAFTLTRLQILKLLSSQMAISLENALFYADLEAKVEERTKALRQLQSQLVQQEKMASLGMLTAGIAHEIQNPLNFVINFSELSFGNLEELKKLLKIYLPAFTKEHEGEVNELISNLKLNLTSINSQGMRAASIVHKMLEHSVATSGVIAPGDLRQLIEQAIQKSYISIQKKHPKFGVAFERKFNPTIGRVQMANENIYRVFLNILNNALFSLWQKKQQLGDTFHPRIVIETRLLNKWVEIKIRDNGVGMSPLVASKVFNPFFTTKSPGEGTGLSLSTSHSIIVQQHGGLLSFQTEEGVFTEFVISLPYSQLLVE